MAFRCLPLLVAALVVPAVSGEGFQENDYSGRGWADVTVRHDYPDGDSSTCRGLAVAQASYDVNGESGIVYWASLSVSLDGSYCFDIPVWSDSMYDCDVAPESVFCYRAECLLYGCQREATLHADGTLMGQGYTRYPSYDENGQPAGWETVSWSFAGRVDRLVALPPL